MSLDRRQLFAASALGAAATAVAGAPAARADDRHRPSRRVTPGADRAAASRWRVLAGRKVGVVTNPTGVLANLHSIVDEMVDSGAVDVRAVFGPEHGFRGTAQAGGSEGTYTDERTGVTVYDAYGATADSLTRMVREAGVDTVVFDIQDVGARFYTYIWTMYTAMRAALRAGADLVVLDRPNPIGGTARGPMMTPAYTSGVGAKEIVQAHGMTVGELARFFDGEFLEADEGRTLGDALEVVQVAGWSRETVFADTGLTWVLPSPNMPTPDTALVYPGTCLFEGTNLSEGRGTTRPFELVGAPFVDHRWAERLVARDVPGVTFREAYFNPVASKFTGEVCGGVQVHVTDPGRLDGPRLGAEMLVAAKALHPEFAWRKDSYDPQRPYWVDKLTGSTRLREMVDAGASADEVVGAWRSELAAFERRRRPYLLYRGGHR
ncbi:MAG: DUF1343 domain-containing protein [Micrococcales bacterium]|nr:DUF1343 domain-containing protein [Micrococcales bacterium]